MIGHSNSSLFEDHVRPLHGLGCDARARRARSVFEAVARWPRFELERTMCESEGWRAIYTFRSTGLRVERCGLQACLARGRTLAPICMAPRQPCISNAFGGILTVLVVGRFSSVGVRRLPSDVAAICDGHRSSSPVVGPGSQRPTNSEGKQRGRDWLLHRRAAWVGPATGGRTDTRAAVGPRQTAMARVHIAAANVFASTPRPQGAAVPPEL